MKITRLCTLLVMLSLAACTFQVSVGETPTLIPTLSTPVATGTPVVVASSTGLPPPTATREEPSLTPVPATATQSQPPSPAQPTTSAEQQVKIFLIALEDNGRAGPLVGCGDSVVPVSLTIPRTQGVLRAALEKLLSARQQFYGESGLYNALYQSDLRLADVTIEQGQAIVYLTGTIVLGGTCDAPRLQAQIEQTALQFSTVSEVDVFVNAVPLEDALSQK